MRQATPLPCVWHRDGRKRTWTGMSDLWAAVRRLLRAPRGRGQACSGKRGVGERGDTSFPNRGRGGPAPPPCMGSFPRKPGRGCSPLRPSAIRCAVVRSSRWAPCKGDGCNVPKRTLERTRMLNYQLSQPLLHPHIYRYVCTSLPPPVLGASTLFCCLSLSVGGDCRRKRPEQQDQP